MTVKSNEKRKKGDRLTSVSASEFVDRATVTTWPTRPLRPNTVTLMGTHTFHKMLALWP